MPLELSVDGQIRHIRLLAGLRSTIPMRWPIWRDADGGLVQAPRYRFARDIAEGAVVEVLGDYSPSPTPLSALYPQNRQLTPRVRVFLDWISRLLKNPGI